MRTFSPFFVYSSINSIAFPCPPKSCVNRSGPNVGFRFSSPRLFIFFVAPEDLPVGPLSSGRRPFKVIFKRLGDYQSVACFPFPYRPVISGIWWCLRVLVPRFFASIFGAKTVLLYDGPALMLRV